MQQFCLLPTDVTLGRPTSALLVMGSLQRIRLSTRGIPIHRVINKRIGPLIGTLKCRDGTLIWMRATANGGTAITSPGTIISSDDRPVGHVAIYEGGPFAITLNDGFRINDLDFPEEHAVPCPRCGNLQPRIEGSLSTTCTHCAHDIPFDWSSYMRAYRESHAMRNVMTPSNMLPSALRNLEL